ncbi:MAG: TRAP transporter large permease, partial [Pseudomonadota bacterium]
MTPVEVSILLAGVLVLLVIIGMRVAFATALIGIVGLFTIFAFDKNMGAEKGFLVTMKIVGQIPHS